MTDLELRNYAKDKKGTIIEMAITIELERRKDRREFLRKDLARWLALVVSLTSLALGIINSNHIWNIQKNSKTNNTSLNAAP